jgi:hypothetical protein
MKNILREEIAKMITEKKDNVTIVNKSQLDKRGPVGSSNWSAEFQVNSKLGKKPYLFQNYQYIPVNKGHKLSDAIYLRDEEAKELNTIGQGVQNLMNIFDQKRQEFDAFTPNHKYKDFDRFK